MNSATPCPPAPTRSGTVAWLLVCIALGAPAALAGWVPLDEPAGTWPQWAQRWALHPDAGWHQPSWTWWTTAWLHGSASHLHKNLAGLALIALLGVVARLPLGAAWAWAAAWPLTHVGMLLAPHLHTYIGLSGVLHAGAAIIGLRQVASGQQHKQIMGGALLLGLILKILMENPWQHPLIRAPGSDINVAPWAHLSGACAGILLDLSTSVTRRVTSVKRLTRRPRTLI